MKKRVLALLLSVLLCLSLLPATAFAAEGDVINATVDITSSSSGGGATASATISVGGTLTINLKNGSPSSAEKTYTTSIADETVAQITPGDESVSIGGSSTVTITVTGLNAGSTVITSLAPGSGSSTYTATINLTVTGSGDPGDPGDPGDVTNATVPITATTGDGPTTDATISVGGTLTINLTNSSTGASKTFATTFSDDSIAEVSSGNNQSIAAGATGTITVKGLKAGETVITFTGTGSGSTYTATINLTVTGSGDPGDPGDPGDVTNATVPITATTGDGPTTDATISVGGTLTINLTNSSTGASKTFATTFSDDSIAEVSSGNNQSIAAGATGTITVKGLKAGETVITCTGTGSGNTYKATINLNVTDSGEPGESQTITYDANGGTGNTESTTGIVGANVTLRANAFTKDGYYFAGWNTQADGNGTSYTEGQKIPMPDEGLELYAKWTELGPIYYQQADSIEDGGTYLIVARTGSGSYAYYALTNEVKSTSFLAGETVTVSGGYVTSPVDESMLWTFITATSGKYDVKNGDDFLLRRSGGSKAGVEIDATDSGAAYSDWAYDGGTYALTVGASSTYYLYYSTSDQYFNCSSSTGDKGTIYLYKQINDSVEPGDSQTITYDANGGTGNTESTTGIVGANVTLRASAFTKAGYYFAGWNTKADGTGTSYTEGQKIPMPAEGLELYAKWTEVEAVSYQLANSIEDGETYLIVARTGSGSYTYYALTNEAVSTNYLAGETVTVDGEYVTSPVDESMLWTFTATPAGDAGTYDITNDTDFLLRIGGGSGPGIKTDATDSGVGYSDWKYNSSTYVLTTFSAASGTDTTYYLYYVTSGSYFSCTSTANDKGTIFLYKQITEDAKTYTVTFDANGGTGTMSAQTASASTELTANAFTRTGFKFTGWNTEEDGTGTPYADGAPYSFDANITLYAQWTENTYKVTFDANGGTGTMSAQTASTSTALTANAFTRTGFKFTGWNTEEDGTGTSYADSALYSFAADITLYAQWAAYGDVDGDGDVTDADRTKLARFLAGWSGYEIDEGVSDVNGDGEVTDQDRTVLARHLAGWIGYEILPYTV